MKNKLAFAVRAMFVFMCWASHCDERNESKR